jgi:hypothetical protein
MKIPAQRLQKIKGGSVILRSSRCIDTSGTPLRQDGLTIVQSFE